MRPRSRVIRTVPSDCRMIGYARVFTSGQKLDMQIDALNRAGCTAIFSDHGASGASTDRPALQDALDALSRGLGWLSGTLSNRLLDVYLRVYSIE